MKIDRMLTKENGEQLMLCHTSTQISILMTWAIMYKQNLNLHTNHTQKNILEVSEVKDIKMDLSFLQLIISMIHILDHI